MNVDRHPLPGETLGEYVDRVIVGRERVKKRMQVRSVTLTFEPSYVFAPYIPVFCLPSGWPESLS